MTLSCLLSSLKKKCPLQYTIKGPHPALILHDHTLANSTIIVSPLSSLYDKNGNKKELKSYHLPLYKKDYPQLDCDSYVKLDQLFTFSRNKMTGNHVCTLSDKDKAAAHLKLIETLQMNDTIRDLISKQIELMVEEALNKYIETVVKKRIQDDNQ